MNSSPLVTIIMPVRNEERYIRRSLEAVLHQDYPQECIKVLIADGLSNDGTRAIIHDFHRAYPRLKIIDNPGKIVPTGMNAALSYARGDIVIRVDGHCEIAPDYVRKCVHYLLQANVDGVGGPVQTIGETPLAEMIALAMSSKFGVGGSAFRTETGKSLLVDSIPFPAYTRAIIQQAGNYDEELVRNQDDEYNYRLRSLGARLLLAPDVQSKYYSRGSLTKLWKQYFLYGFWKVRVLQKHPRQMRPRQFVPPAFVAAILVSILFFFISQFSNFNLQFLFFLVTGSYILANFTASVLTAAKKGWRYMTLLPLVFAILHISYGLGFLAGLVRFWNRWGDKVGKVPAWSHSAGPLPSDN